MKKCAECKFMKDDSLFGSGVKKCADCRNRHARETESSMRVAVLRMLGGACVCCKVTESVFLEACSQGTRAVPDPLPELQLGQAHGRMPPPGCLRPLSRRNGLPPAPYTQPRARNPVNGGQTCSAVTTT